MSQDRPELVHELATLFREDPKAAQQLLLGLVGGDPISQALRARTSPEPWDVGDRAVTFTVRLDLNHVKPPIWRRLRLAGDLTLAELHHIVQAAMGWTGGHLHQFTMGPGAFDHRMQPFVTDFDLEEGDLEEGDEGIDEDDVRLDQVVRAVGDRLYYEYDFGDGWEHTIRVEEVAAPQDGAPRAVCLTGRRACPPEDVGGIPGYEEVLAGLADRDAVDDWTREKIDSWLPLGFDPVAFDVDETDAAVRDAAELV